MSRPPSTSHRADASRAPDKAGKPVEPVRCERRSGLGVMLTSLLLPALALACGGVWVRQGAESPEDASLLLWLALLVPFLLLAAGMWAVWRTAREDARRDE